MLAVFKFEVIVFIPDENGKKDSVKISHFIQKILECKHGLAKLYRNILNCNMVISYSISI